MKSNDPDNPILELLVKGSVDAIFRISPATIFFGKISGDEELLLAFSAAMISALVRGFGGE